jgi:hypothetical protein
MLLAVDVFLAAAYILTHIIAPEVRLGPIREFLNVDREVSMPTWFSATQLFIVAVVLWDHARNVGELHTFFLVLACGFLFLSMDEAAAVHDNIFRFAQRRKLPWLAGVEYLAWMVPYALAGLLGIVICFRPAWSITRRFPREAGIIVLGGALFVGGGVGLEIVTHLLYVIAVDAHFFLAVAAEEFCEMAGVTVMLYGFLLLGIRLQTCDPAKTA